MSIIKVNGADVDIEQIGSGRDLILLHSLLADRSAFDRVSPLLSKKRRLWLVNLPGYGASSAAGASIEDYAGHIAGLIRALGLSQQTDVLGNGLGGFIAVALAAKHGELFDRLVVADSVAAFPAPAKEPLQRMAERVRLDGMSAVLDPAIQRMFPEPFIAAHPAIVAERKSALANADPECFRTACMALARVDFTPVLARIHNPALVMVGALDGATPVPLARQLATGITGSKFLEIPDCGHCPQIEKPDAFVRAIDEFLD
ncbi:MAG TPA: alpha/beta hydrolase [Acidiferrobacterales bacterium]|nr:alpha/beta hydrolase [Acidiferrobacterales bacterium]